MFEQLRRQYLTVLVVALCILSAAAVVSGQDLTVDQWVNLLGTGNEQAFEYFVAMGPDAVPVLADAIANRWMFHAYIPQRLNVVKVMREINHLDTLPILKTSLTFEQSIRTEAIDAILELPDLSIPELFVELLNDQVDYQVGLLEMLRKLFDQDHDLIAILDETFALLAADSFEPAVVDKTADLIAHFIIEDKKVVVPAQKVTREMILQALLAQQQAKEEPQEEKEPIDINAEIFKLLEAKISESQGSVQALALRSVGRLADLVRGLELGSEHNLEGFVPGLVAVLVNAETETNNRLLAARALEQIVPHSPEAVAAFAELLFATDTDAELRLVAVRVVETAGTSALAHLKANFDRLAELEPALRWRLAGALANGAKADSELITMIAALLDSSDPEVQLYAVRVLQAVGSDAEAAVPALVQVYQTADSDLKQAAGEALVRIAPNSEQTKALSLAAPTPVKPTQSVPAFPGAEGRGASATGGRGGEVYIVTNLRDSGPGSLRDAVSKPNRTVVFAVSGTIRLNSQLRTAANITIAGQTAPGDGITVADYPSLIGGSNSIVRYLRFRLGDRRDLTSSDALNVDRNISNVILDHLSVSWGTDEVFSSYDNTDITVQYCMFGEGLNWVNHSAVGLWGPRATYHHNLIYSNKTRHPKLAYLGDIVDFNNNVIYNWRERSVYTGSQGRINFIGNYFKPGPETRSNVRAQLLDPDGDDVRVYITGNVMEGSETVTQDNWRGVIKSAMRVDAPYPSAPMTIDTAEEAYAKVLAHAGASLPRRDAVDERIINDVINGTGKVILRQSEVGGFPIMNSVLPAVDTDQDGMPDMWEIYHGLDPFDPADRNYDRTGDGYTNLEEYLNAFVEGHPLLGQ